MGCFLACFGTSKNDHNRRKYRNHNQVQPRDHQRLPSFKAVQSVEPAAQSEVEEPVVSVQEIRENLNERPNSSPRKKVTFDSNVRTYEHVPVHEGSNLFPESEDVETTKEEKEDTEKSTMAKSSSSSSSNSSSLVSYPPNHRYQNCRDSDDEEEQSDFGDSDLDVDDDDEDEDEDDDEDEEDGDGEIEYEDEIAEPKRVSEEVNSPAIVSVLPDANRNARDRSCYIHSVLNPVENLTQWKAVKAKHTTKTRPQKENFSSDQESRISFSSDPIFKPQTDQTVKPKQEMAVDASLSTWLVTPETKPVNKTSSFVFDSRSPDQTTSQGSNSVMSLEERPILGALTVEEIRQFSATSSPRKSPSRSPDDMPLIGTVGTHWNHEKDLGSASSFKGIPNTTSKYREDKRVNWHDTPFTTRLERALNTGRAEA